MFVRKGGASPRPPFYRRTPCSRRRGGRPCPPLHSVSGGLFVGGDAHAAKQVPLGCIAPYATAAPWHKASLCEGGVMAFGHDGGREKRETGGAEPRPYASSTEGVCFIRAGRCTPRVLVPLRSTAWASPPTKSPAARVYIFRAGRVVRPYAPPIPPPQKKNRRKAVLFLLCLIPRRRGRPPPALRLPRPPARAAPSRGRTPPPWAARAGSPPPPRGQVPPPACDRPSGPHRRG